MQLARLDCLVDTGLRLGQQTTVTRIRIVAGAELHAGRLSKDKENIIVKGSVKIR